ncbi:Smr/MutS family protein [Sphingomonas sp.]|uniref:Smr/MutS family protein n=1 Tax=Sphingomonas sp. TaxID=28214 RepID=UPI002DBFD316|nr:Smr/MutS family protein [Sphingomonas sp.]HEU4967797.1 Smr/MutS family protein [Sphingomonas sp.]
MRERPLSPEEARLWARLVATVEPLAGRAAEPVTPKPFVSSEVEKRASTRSEPKGFSTSLEANGARKAPAPSNTLDGSWDRRLSRGFVAPELAVDLHGHTLDTAYRTLDAGLEAAIARGIRVLLLVTGKPRDPGSGRGAIRAAVGDWLASSRHSADIAAVRNAHPRHGGAGALYIILKRPRTKGH